LCSFVAINESKQQKEKKRERYKLRNSKNRVKEKLSKNREASNYVLYIFANNKNLLLKLLELAYSSLIARARVLIFEANFKSNRSSYLLRDNNISTKITTKTLQSLTKIDITLNIYLI